MWTDKTLFHVFSSLEFPAIDISDTVPPTTSWGFDKNWEWGLVTVGGYIQVSLERFQDSDVGRMRKQRR